MTGSSILRTFLLSLLLTVAASSDVFSQSRFSILARSDTSQKTDAYMFVSPNTQTSLSLKEAARKLNSPEEISLILDARKLACRLDVNAEITKTIGSWRDGAENSSLIKVNSDEATARYMSAWLGFRFKQKSVLIFQRNLSGSARMYVVTVKNERRSPALISKALDAKGIDFRAIARGRHQTRIYVVDLENKLRRNVVAAASALRARSFVLKGVGEFIGNDSDILKAQKSFSEIIERYEAAKPQAKRECLRAKPNSSKVAL
jgi:hypothetical protein